MKHIQNTLYVTQPKSYLFKEGETVVVKRDNEKVIQLPIHAIGQIVCFGFEIILSPPLMYFCAENGVSIAWMSEFGKFLGRVEGPIKGNVLLRREQHRFADDDGRALEIAKTIVAAKVNNSRISLLRFLRNQENHDKTDEIRFQTEKMIRLLSKIGSCTDVDSLRGIEGEAASSYFQVFDHQIVKQKEAFQFKGRSRRPPLDRVNAILSFLYTLLVFDIRSALESVGLDPYIGFLHSDRPGRPSLALDLMEEFRAPLADRLTLSLINLKILKPGQFREEGAGEVLMNDTARKEVISAYQNRKKEVMLHPFLEEKMEIGLLFHTQARLLARYIRGDLDFYPAFLWR